jgi:biotin transporter BioY
MTVSLDLAGLNWLAVLVGAVVYFVIGALWFAPQVFGKPWMAAIGWDESRPRPEMNPVSYVGPAIFYLVSAIATGLLANATGTDNLTEGITLGLVVGVGYALVVTATDAVFDPNKPKPWNWFAISGAYHVVSLAIVGAIIGAWQ